MESRWQVMKAMLSAIKTSMRRMVPPHRTVADVEVGFKTCKRLLSGQ